MNKTNKQLILAMTVIAVAFNAYYVIGITSFILTIIIGIFLLILETYLSKKGE